MDQSGRPEEAAPGAHVASPETFAHLLTSDRLALARANATRRRPRPLRWLFARRRRSITALAVLLVAALAVPVPWLHVISDDPPGTAWRLDGRLEVNGTTVDPPGRWSWLAVGRPQLVGEVLYDRLVGRDDTPVDLRSGSITRRPALSEPAAAAVGLRHMGHDLALGLLVEVREPLLEGYPETAQLAAVNGIALTDRQAWQQASSGWQGPAEVAPAEDGPPGEDPEPVTFRLSDGRQFSAPGPALPYAEINALDLAPQELEAGISFKVTQFLPGDWFRNLSLGSSHGMMVALTTYAYSSGRDLAQGRHIAGTGGIRGDGTVTAIGGLTAKANAAHRAGADVLLVPASQAHHLEDKDLTGMSVVPVETLGEAIERLAAPVA